MVDLLLKASVSAFTFDTVKVKKRKCVLNHRNEILQ